MAQNNWEADKMLDVYIYDYLVKRKLHASAKAFQDEGKVSSDPVAIDAPGGFLFEWWSVFWDIFIARTNEKHSESAASYIETQLIKARELQQHHQKPQQQQQMQKPQQPQQMHMQQLLLQRNAQQQQHREGIQLPNGSGNGLSGNDPLAMQNPGSANVLAPKMYEDRLKPLVQRDPMDDTDMKQKFGDNMGHPLDPIHTSSMRSASAGGQPLGQPMHGPPGGISGNLQQVQNRTQQLPLSAHDIKNEVNPNPIMDPRAAGPEGSFIGVQGSNHGGNNLTLKGWPLTGLDQLRPGLFQQRKSLMQPSQPFHQLQLQQQLLLQPQQNSTSPSANDLESTKLRVLLNNRNMGLDGASNVGSPAPVGCSASPRGDADMLMKLQQQQLQNNNPQQQQFSQHPLSSQQSQNSNHHHQHQDKLGGSGSVTVDPNMSSTFGVNDQASKNQIGRKRKQPASSSGPANSSGTGNTVGPSASSAPSTPSTHTPGDVISMANLPYTGSSTKPLLMFGSDGLPNLTSASNQLADLDRFVDDGSLDDNVESFLAQDDGDPRDTVAQRVDVSKGFTFSEVAHFCASTSKVDCCHFSSDGKLLATGGQDKKAVLWCTDSQNKRSTLEEHSFGITDIRFSPSMPRLATSSHDGTVRVWDADNPGYSLRTFIGHSSSVMSLDFHPNKEDLICSCDSNGEIRYWSVNNGNCTKVSKGAMTNVRFQPRIGKFFAAAAENTVSIFDVETQACRHSLQGHRNVQSLCWDPSGEYMASASDDLVRVWRIGPGGEAESIHDLSGIGKKFNCCVFHPSYSSALLIGCYQSLELWDMSTTEKKTMILSAHDGQIASLAASNVTGLVASVGHDKIVKLWK